MSSEYQVCDPLTEEEREALKSSITEHGVRVPVEVDEEGNILDGHNRFEIARELGIPCPISVKSGLRTDDEKRAYARELNCARRQMTIDAKKKIARDMIEEDKSRSNRTVARVVGLSLGTVNSIRRDMGLSEQDVHSQCNEDAEGEKPSHEWVNSPEWQTWHRMEAFAYLAKLTDEEQLIIDEILDQRPRQPKDALRMLETVANFDEKDRTRMVELWQSKLDQERRLVVSRLAGVSPMPDPRISTCLSIIREMEELGTGTFIREARRMMNALLEDVRSSEVTW